MLKMSFLIQGLIRLSNHELIFLVRSKVYRLIGYHRVTWICLVHHQVRCLDEPVLVDSCIGSQGVNQTDVRSFRGLDRTHSSVVGIVYISYLETCTISGKTAGSQCGKSSLMGKLGKRIILVHELRQLGGTEEFLYRCRYRLNVD